MLDKDTSPYSQQVAVELEAFLNTLTKRDPKRLHAREIKRCYPHREFVAGWRICMQFSDGVTRSVDIVTNNQFPFSPVRTALVDRPPFLTWPHVERDGILCLLPNTAECDPDDPKAVTENLLNRSARLVELLIEGLIIERDLRQEFLTYWAHESVNDGTHIYSLLKPGSPSRLVHVWSGNAVKIVGENSHAVSKWVRNRFGKKSNANVEKAAFIWLPHPPLPAQYPKMASDLYELAKEAGHEAVSVCDKIAMDSPDRTLCVLGSVGRGGPGLVSVEVSNPELLRHGSHTNKAPMTKGFRPNHVPPSLTVRRFFGQTNVVRKTIQRADPEWVHGRGRDSRTDKLLDSTVIVVGCGSIGGPVSVILAQAGVGRMILIDHDCLKWPNVGRHPLGASSVNRNKANELAERLQREYPHLEFESRDKCVKELLQDNTDLFKSADLIIAATGSWSAEHRLNKWHIEHGRIHPILYGWTEAHACAGQAVVISREGGCLQCQFGGTGTPAFEVVEWPDGGHANQQEPACGVNYQPYGPVELSYVTTMVCEVALDCLLNPPSQSFSRIHVPSRQRLEELGGRLTHECTELIKRASILEPLDRPWSRTECTAC